MIGAQRVHHDDQHIGRIRSRRRQFADRPRFEQPVAALDSGERQYSRPGNQGEGSPYKLQRGGFVLRHPAAEGNAHAGRQQQAAEMRKTGRDCKPVVQSKRSQQGYGGLQQAEFRNQPSHCPQEPASRHENRMRSTMGEIQMIGSETCRVGPHRAQLILWNSNRPAPSTRPAMIANQMARSRKDPMRGGDPAWRGWDLSCRQRTRHSTKCTPNRRGTIGNGRRELR